MKIERIIKGCSRGLVRISPFIAMCVFLTGCGSLSHSTSLQNITALPKEAIFLGSMTNKTSAVIAFDYESYYRTELQAELAKKSVSVSTEASSNDLVLNTFILEYAAGNAFKRWLFPGYGSSICTLRVEVISQSSQQMVAVINARRSISFGGAYTIGAFKTVFRDVARAVAKQLAEQMNTI